MKKQYITILLILISITLNAQTTYEFSVSFVGVNANTGNYQMALLATPSEAVTNNSTDDMGAGFYVPTGLTIGNFVTGNSNLPASEWESISMGAGTFGDAYFLGRDEAGQFTVLLNGAGPFELVLFDVIADPNPTTGAIIFVENGDPVFNTIFIENYMNIGIQNLYSQNNPLASAVSFQTLNIDPVNLDNVVSIYPNPVSDILHIKTQNTIRNIKIFTVLGSQVLKTNSTEINVSNMQSGTYILKVQTDLGQTVKKLIIK